MAEIYQVVNVSDFRFPGGTSHSVAAEVKAQFASGIHTALAHVDSNVHKRAHPWSKPIQQLLAADMAEMLRPGISASTKLIVIRHPAVITEGFFPYDVTTDNIVVIANHVPRDADGSVNYDVEEADRILRDRFGMEPTWYPIGPVVREGLLIHSQSINLGPDDWTNTLDDISNEVEARKKPNYRPVIGRHSRAQASKWPDTARQIRAAYPMDQEFDVRVLGGALPVQQILGKVPANWTVYPFGSMSPRSFLKEVDFWVYFHHSKLLEAFGRAIMEALEAGCVVILPHYLESSYGDAAVYADPEEVREIIRGFVNDPVAFENQSRAGLDYVSLFGPEKHLKRLEDLEIEAKSPIEMRKEALPPNEKSYRTGLPTVLFITSNGAGMGHLTRLLSIAQSGKESFRPVFISLSSAVPVVRNFDIPYEYIMSSGAMGVSYKPWNRYFASRLKDILDTYAPDAVVFDGTVPYGGLLQVLSEVRIRKIWIRRGMWKQRSSAVPLKRALDFDLVIEPGDYASEFDKGPTKGLVEPIQPVVLVSDKDTMCRENARAELGIGDEERVALVTLGAGNINSIRAAQEQAISSFRRNGWRVFVTKPPIAAQGARRAMDQEHEVISIYPIARLSAAFDAVVSACGYNSYHEWLAAGVPGVWVPNEATSIDDQVARAEFAAEMGVGFAARANDLEALDLAISTVIDDAVRERMVAKMSVLPRPTGAIEAANQIVASLTLSGGTR